MPVARAAALFDGYAVAGEVWAPSVLGEVEIHLTYSTTFEGADTNICGVFSSARVRLTQESNGSLRIISNATLVTVPDVIIADGAPHRLRVVMGVNTQDVYLDGELIGSGTATFSYGTSLTTHYIGNASTTAPGFRGALWDVSYIDPNDDTNTMTFVMDAIVEGAFINSHPGSALGNADIVVDGVEFVRVSSTAPAAPIHPIAAAGVTRADIAEAAGVPGVRRAVSYDGSSGPRVLSTWGPTTQAFEYRIKLEITPITGDAIIGSGTPGVANVVVGASGLKLRNGTTELAVVAVTLPAGAFELRVIWSSTGADVYVDDVLVDSPTWGSVTWTVTPTVRSFGSRHATADHITGEFWDVHLIDPADDTNTAFFPLDARLANGDFENTHPTSTVADAESTGYIGQTLINSPGPCAPVFTGPLVCSRAQTSAKAITVDSNISYDTNVDDVHGMALSTRTAISAQGHVVISLTGRVRATVLPSTFDLEVQVEWFSAATLARQEITLDTLDKWVPFCIQLGVGEYDAATQFNAKLVGIPASTTVQYDDVYWTLTLYPTVTA